MSRIESRFAALKKQGRAGLITFVPTSQGRDMYPYHKNFAPRLGLAYSPHGESGLSKFLFGGPGKTSIRAGAGMYYDVIGQPLAQLFDSTAFGLASSLTSPPNTPLSPTWRTSRARNPPSGHWRSQPPAAITC